MRCLLLATTLWSTLLAGPALADDGCACGEAGCEQACTCSAGVCPLHRPGKTAATKDAAAQATPAKKASAPSPRPVTEGTGASAAPRAPAAL